MHTEIVSRTQHTVNKVLYSSKGKPIGYLESTRNGLKAEDNYYSLTSRHSREQIKKMFDGAIEK